MVRKVVDSCFVIQPFDNDKFDRRYVETFEPALKAANLNPYRVDKDFGVNVPIEAIESNIRKAKICFADITLDNPNVWYELGFAFACGKEVIMVCSEEREVGKYPFDIRHKSIINYKTGSLSDFTTLSKQITQKAEALLSNVLAQELALKDSFDRNPLISKSVESFKFKHSEVQIFRSLIEEQPGLMNGVYSNHLQTRYMRSGFSEFQYGLAILKLTKSGFIDRVVDDSNNGFECIVYRISDKGEEWILSNEELILVDEPKYNLVNDEVDNDLPF